MLFPSAAIKVSILKSRVLLHKPAVKRSTCIVVRLNTEDLYCKFVNLLSTAQFQFLPLGGVGILTDIYFF